MQFFFKTSLLAGYFLSSTFLWAPHIVAQESEGLSILNNQQFVTQTFNQQSGLPVVSLTDMVLGADNHLYIASSGGVSRFNGTNFEEISTEQYPQLNSNRILFLYATPDSSIWMVDEQYFFSRWKKGSVTTFDSLFVSESHSEWELKVSNSGSVWISNGSEFRVFKEHTGFQKEISSLNQKYYDFIPVSDSLIFILTQSGLQEYDGDNLSLRLPANQLPFNAEAQHAFYWETNLWQLTDHTIAIADSGALGVFNADNSNYALYPFSDKMGSTPPSVLPVNDHQLLVSTLDAHFNLNVDNGTYTEYQGTLNEEIWSFNYDPIWNGKRLYISESSVNYGGKRIYKTQNEERIAQVVQDQEGNLWLTVAGRGLVRITLNPFSVLNSNNGLQSDNIYSTIESSNGNIWLASFEYGIHCISEQGIDFWSRQNGDLVNNLVWSLYERQNGNIISGFWDSGLFEFDGVSWNQFLLNDTLLLGQAESFYEDPDGSFWIGSRLGLYKRPANSDTFYQQYTHSGDPVLRTQVIREDPKGRLWLGTHGSGLLLHSASGEITPIEFEELNPQPKIRDLYFTNKDTLWVATESNGLIRTVFNASGKIQSYDILTQKDGLPDVGIHRILPDPYGYFWLSSNQGIVRIEEAALNAHLDERSPSLWTEIFTEDDGLPIREANGGTQSNGIIASDSTIWIPTQKGVVHFNPADFLNWNPYEHTRIEVASIQSKNKTYRPYGDHKFTVNKEERSLTIDFDLIHYTNPQNISIEYRIPVLGSSWNLLSQDRQLTITNLPPGSHFIETRLTGVPSHLYAGNTFTLSVPYYFYERTWFDVLLAGAFLFLISFIFYLNNRTAHKREEILNQRVLERTDLLNKQKAETEKALETIQEQARELEKLNKVKTDFFINMTHELRTPLALIKGPLNLLKDTSRQKNIDQKEQLSLIERNSIQLNKVIDQLLNLLRMESDSVQFKPKKINLTEFVRVHAAQFQSSEDLTNKTFIIPNQSNEILTVADPETLTLIVNNLISNAIKYTREGDVITLRVSKSGEYSVFEIQDTGIGIPKNEIDQIFDPFYRSENVTTQKGSGIGLSIVKSFIDRMKGKIDIQSELDKGTTIKIFFPTPEAKQLENFEYFHLSKVKSPETLFKPKQKETQSQEQLSKSEKGQKPNLLIVEDNDDLQLFLTRLLEQDYHLHVSGNGEAALEYLEGSTPDLIISDVMMPKMDGITFVQSIRKNEDLRFIPVILLSAKKSNKSIQEGLSAGAQVYLTKPLDNQVLFAQIESLLEREKRLISINGQPSLKKSSPKKELQSTVDELILRHISDPDLSVEEIAKTLHMSRPTLYRKWRKITETGLSEYIVQTRLKESIKLITEKDYSFAEASVVCGFSEPSYFSRVFKKYYNQTPTKYFNNEET